MKLMKRTSGLALLLLTAACAHQRPSDDPFGAFPTLPTPDEAQRLAHAETRPGPAADLAWLCGNDRALARRRLDEGIAADPTDASLRLRRAQLALLELRPQAAAEDLRWVIQHDVEGSAAEVALQSLLDELGLGLELVSPETREAVEAGRRVRPTTTPTLEVLTARALARGARFRARGKTAVADREEAELFTRAGALSAFVSRGPLLPFQLQSIERPEDWERFLLAASNAGATTAPTTPALPRGAFERTLTTRAGFLDGAREQGPGLYVAETYFEVPAGKTQTVRFWVDARVQVRMHLDGALLLERVETNTVLPGVMERQATLEPGWHHLVTASLSMPRSSFAVFTFDERGRPLSLRTEPRRPQSVAIAASKLAPVPDPKRTLIERVARALRASEEELSVRLWVGLAALGPSNRDLELARAAMGPSAARAPQSAILAALRARVMQQEGQPRALVEAELRKGLKLDPSEPSLLQAVARALGVDEPERALQLVERLRSAAPSSSAADELAFYIHARRGWNHEAESALLAAEAKGASPELLDEAARYFRAQFRLAEAEERDEASRRLKGTRPRRGAVRRALESGDLDRAIALLEKSLETTADQADVLRRLASLELERGRWERARSAAEKLEALAPWSTAGPELAAAALLGEGRAGELAPHLQKLNQLGVEDVELEQIRAESEGRLPGTPRPGSALEARLRLDVLELARTPVESGLRGFREVLLLDRVVDYVRPSGHAVSSRHSVARLLTKEATDRAGEFNLGSDALALELRTLKSDGRIVEVDQHEGKADLSFSALAPGDTVERKWVVVDAPATALGGYTRSFFFRDDVPSKRSEYFVVVPKGTPVRWHSYHGAPEPEVFEDGSEMVYAFTRRDIPGMRLEPMAVAFEEYVPFVSVTVGLDAETARRANRAFLYGVALDSYQVRARARELTTGLSTPRAQLEGIFRFVADEIRPGPSNDPAVTLSLGRGNRIFLFTALARAAGLEAELVMARAGRQSWLEPSTPDPRFFGQPLVLVQLRDPDLRVFAELSGSSRSRAGGAWLGAAPAAFRGGRYIRISDPESRPIAFSDEEVERNETTTTIDLSVGSDGDAEGTVTLSIPGGPGSQAKEMLEPMRSHELKQALQGLLASTIPGTELRELELLGLDDRLRPLELELRVVVHGLLSPENGAMVSNRFFPRFISGLLAGLAPFEGLIQVPVRESPMLLPTAAETLQVTLHFPAGTPPPTRLPDAFERKQVWGGMKQRAHYEADTLHFERRIEMNGGRVQPDEYAAFLSVVQELTLLMRSELRFDVPAKAAAGR